MLPRRDALDDIAAVATAALTEGGHAGQCYAITGPEPLTFADAARVISNAAGRTIVHRNISSEELVEALQRSGMPADYAAMIRGDMEAIRDGHGARATDVVERVGGQQPTRFADYAKRAAGAWVRA